MAIGARLALVAVLAACWILAACRPNELKIGYRILPGDELEAEPVSQAVLLVADNQQQYLLGKPVWMRTAFADKVVSKAVRAPQLDLFGPSVLEWTLRSYSRRMPTIHLGDALNLSCREEYDRFLATMSLAEKFWFMAPGNHDGIYFGSSDAKNEWKDACDGGGGPLTKAQFVEAYLWDVLAGRSAAGRHHAKDAGALQFARDFRRESRGDWRYSGDVHAWLRRVAWRVDHAQPHHSFVLQEIDATRPGSRPARYVLLDTSNYKHAPTLLPLPPHVNPGTTGDIDREQLDRLRAWLKSSDEEEPVSVLFAHHPFASLTARARSTLEDLRDEYGVLLYVSAHTHHGDYFVNSAADGGWLELNVGSILDWPIEFRSFRILRTKSTLYTNSHLFDLAELWEDPNAPACKPSWQPQLGDPDYYVDYAKSLEIGAQATQLLIFDSLLHSYRRLLREVPSAANNQRWPPSSGATSDAALQAFIAQTLATPADQTGLLKRKLLLRELEIFDRKRLLAPVAVPAAAPAADAERPAGAPASDAAPAPASGDPSVPASTALADAATVHRDYRLCQAIWASQDDEITVRRARREDLYIEYPNTP